MRRATVPLIILAAMAGCGSPPTEQEQNLPQQAPDAAVPVAGDGNAALNDADVAGNRAGIGGATQGPTASDSDAPYAGDGSNSGD